MDRYINCFEVPEGNEDDFLRTFRAVNEHMSQQPGYISHRLHRAVAPGARYCFINYVEWESIDHWRRAHDETFQRLVSAPEWANFTSTPGHYEIVDEGGIPPS